MLRQLLLVFVPSRSRFCLGIGCCSACWLPLWLLGFGGWLGSLFRLLGCYSGSFALWGALLDLCLCDRRLSARIGLGCFNSLSRSLTTGQLPQFPRSRGMANG